MGPSLLNVGGTTRSLLPRPRTVALEVVVSDELGHYVAQVPVAERDDAPENPHSGEDRTHRSANAFKVGTSAAAASHSSRQPPSKSRRNCAVNSGSRSWIRVVGVAHGPPGVGSGCGGSAPSRRPDGLCVIPATWTRRDGESHRKPHQVANQPRHRHAPRPRRLWPQSHSSPVRNAFHVGRRLPLGRKLPGQRRATSGELGVAANFSPEVEQGAPNARVFQPSSVAMAGWSLATSTDVRGRPGPRPRLPS